jgi:uncharacterized membrane protein
MTEHLILIGMVLTFVGIALVILGIVLTLLKSKQAKTEGGFILWIGPFPILGGATSKEIFYILLVISIIFISLFIILNIIRR